MILSFLIDIFHILFIFTPIFIFFIPKKYFYITKAIILILFLVPNHWMLFDNKCILTILSNKLGGLEYDNKSDSPFIDKYLGKFKSKIVKKFNMTPENEHISNDSTIIWTVVYIVLFYFIFYFLDCKKI